jgi:hypothetical protein
MLKDEEIRVDSYRLEDGRRAYQMTHLPSGVSVEDDADSDEAILTRLRKLREQLEAAIAAQPT